MKDHHQRAIKLVRAWFAFGATERITATSIRESFVSYFRGEEGEAFDATAFRAACDMTDIPAVREPK